MKEFVKKLSIIIIIMGHKYLLLFAVVMNSYVLKCIRNSVQAVSKVLFHPSFDSVARE
jgi:hypothetical protein